MNELEVKLSLLKDWNLSSDKKSLIKEFHFKSYLKNISFLNAIVFIANKQNHHPDLVVKYNLLIVTITTHDDGGLTEKDFALASAIDQLDR